MNKHTINWNGMFKLKESHTPKMKNGRCINCAKLITSLFYFAEKESYKRGFDDALIRP